MLHFIDVIVVDDRYKIILTANLMCKVSESCPPAPC